MAKPMKQVHYYCKPTFTALPNSQPQQPPQWTYATPQLPNEGNGFRITAGPTANITHVCINTVALVTPDVIFFEIARIRGNHQPNILPLSAHFPDIQKLVFHINFPETTLSTTPVRGTLDFARRIVDALRELTWGQHVSLFLVFSDEEVPWNGVIGALPPQSGLPDPAALVATTRGTIIAIGWSQIK